MAFDSKFEARYIRDFAEQVRGGISPSVYHGWVERIRPALSEIGDPAIKLDALARLGRISNYGAIHIEDPQGSRLGIADEIEELATFVAKI